MSASVLYDAPGPRARARNRLLTVVSAAVLLGVAYFVYARFDAKDQWAAEKWKPFLEADVWTTLIWPGLQGTIKAALVAGVLAMAFGVVFGLARLSDRRWIRVPAGAVVEFFRSIPLLLLIFLAFFGSFALIGQNVSAFTAVVFGLTLYNGSVLAEIVRAGVRAVPKGQSEAAYALGLRKHQVMRLVLLPQAITAMMPVIVAQLVVLLKDSALGFIIGYEELLRAGSTLVPANFFNVIPAVIVTALIYIAINVLLSWFAHWLERRNARRGRAVVPADVAEAEALEHGVAPGPGGPSERSA